MTSHRITHCSTCVRAYAAYVRHAAYGTAYAAHVTAYAAHVTAYAAYVACARPVLQQLAAHGIRVLHIIAQQHALGQFCTSSHSTIPKNHRLGSTAAARSAG
eukprot:1036882-Rhodomonas_salina.1